MNPQQPIVRFLFAALLLLVPIHVAAESGATGVLAHRAIDSNPQAQLAFDEGLTALYGFAPDVARQKFEAAAAADPQAAMPLWGVALSYGPNINESYDAGSQARAHRAIARAKRLETGSPPADRALIEAAAARYASTGASDGERSSAAYFQAMRVAANAFPNDPDVLALAAESALELHPWAWYDKAGKPADGIPDALLFLHSALVLQPSHLGALHFTIHATEMSQNPDVAVAAAQRLAGIDVPAYAEHLAHMPAHTFMRVGLYHEAGEANARALARNPDASGYRNHDAFFGTDAFMMSGERARANALAGEFSDPATRERAKARVVVRFNDCARTPISALTTAFSRGVCAARLGDKAAAARELADLRSSGNDIEAIATLVIKSEIARAGSDFAGRIALLRKAVAIQDGLYYDEPPMWFYPVRESLGAALLGSGDAEGARAVFERDLEINPLNPRSLFGLALAQRRLGHATEAASAAERFKRAWKYADATLTLEDL